jgi:hypothetical protein
MATVDDVLTWADHALIASILRKMEEAGITEDEFIYEDTPGNDILAARVREVLSPSECELLERIGALIQIFESGERN